MYIGGVCGDTSGRIFGNLVLKEHFRMSNLCARRMRKDREMVLRHIAHLRTRCLEHEAKLPNQL
jgi:hypothetical protein